jgi:hypothetical protein
LRSRCTFLAAGVAGPRQRNSGRVRRLVGVLRLVALRAYVLSTVILRSDILRAVVVRALLWRVGVSL